MSEHIRIYFIVIPGEELLYHSLLAKETVNCLIAGRDATWSVSMEVSRSEQKRRIKQLEQLINEVAGLSDGLIAEIPCTEEIRELFREAAAMKGGTRKRQVKYITKLLKNEPVDELYDFLSKRKGASLKEKKEFHELEFYRDSLLNETLEAYREARENQEEPDEEQPGRATEEICSMLPNIDRKALTSLAWLFARTRSRKYSREIFRLLRSAQEQQKMLQNRS